MIGREQPGQFSVPGWSIECPQRRQIQSLSMQMPSRVRLPHVSQTSHVFDAEVAEDRRGRVW